MILSSGLGGNEQYYVRGLCYKKQDDKVYLANKGHSTWSLRTGGQEDDRPSVTSQQALSRRVLPNM